jgi:hypothetical protein
MKLLRPIHGSILAFAALAGAGVALAAVAAARPAPACAAGCADEAEPFLNATTLVQPALLSGPDFRVVPEVQVRGYMANFLIDTDYGPLHAGSRELLGVRVAEMPAIQTLDRASRTGAFAHALAARGGKTAAAIGNVFSHPVDTIAGLPGGVARYLRKRLDSWGHRAQSLADQTARHAENRGDPYRAPEGPMTAGRDTVAGDDPAPASHKNHAWYARLGSEGGREARRYLKYSQQRRALAQRLGVDPNTTNPILNDKLDALAWAAVAGNFSAGEALGAITGAAATIVGTSAKLNQYVLQQDPEQVREAIHQRLLALCSDDEAIRSFLHRGGFTDTLRVAATDALEALAPQHGCNDVIELAATTRGEVEARYLVDALELIRAHAVAGRGQLLVTGAAIAWQADDGALLLPLPVDYLSWSHAIDDFFDQRVFAAADKTILMTGEASLQAQQELTERSWNLRFQARHPGAAAAVDAPACEPCARLAVRQ